MKGDGLEADWLAWGLQFVLGSVVGGVIAWWVVMPGRFSRAWSHMESLPVLVIGMLLLGGGAASLKGDCLWMGRSNWCDRRPRHSAFSRRLARVSLLSGAGLALAAGAWRMAAG